MNPKCAKCEKTVYPLEKLNCLDKYWHKACFKCWECGMTLNMKNYKGYDKKPYCNAHYPSMKHTQVAETPEMARIAQNTKLQSNVQYHKEFEEGKGKYTAVGTDDPEMSRLLKNQKKVSSVEYHKDFEEAKGKFTGVGTEDPEIARLLKNQQKISTVVYHDEFEKARGKHTQVADDPETMRHLRNMQNISSIKYHEDFEKNIKGTKIQVADDPETARIRQNMATISQVEYKGLRKQHDNMESQRGNIGKEPQAYHQPPPPADPVPPPSSYNQPPPPQQAPPKAAGMVRKALYDYAAGDDDEVSFQENDLIINCEPIDEGWMFGTNERTGQRGMLPANYVGPV